MVLLFEMEKRRKGVTIILNIYRIKAVAFWHNIVLLLKF